MRVAVLGATGLRGAAIARVIAATGYTLRAVAPRGASRRPLGEVAARAEWRDATLSEPTALARALRDQDAVICAEPALPPWNTPNLLRGGVERVRNLLSAARACGVAHVVYLGSAVTVGRTPGEGARLTEMDTYTPGAHRDPWFDMAYAVECEVLAANSYAMHTSALMHTALIGPGCSDQPLLRAMRRLPVLLDSPCDVLDVRSLASTAFRAVRLARSGQRYLVPGHATTLGDIALTISRLTDTPPPRLIRASLAPLAARVSPRRLQPFARFASCPGPFDGTKARVELQHKPRKLKESLRDMIAAVDAPGSHP